MESEYIIVNKTAILKRIEELEIEKQKNPYSAYYTQPLNIQINTLRRILSESTPLISEIEKAFDESRLFIKPDYEPKFENSEHYIKNLKLDII